MQKFILLVDSDDVRARQLKDALEQSDPDNICVVWAKDANGTQEQLESDMIEFGIFILGNIREELHEIIELVKNYRGKCPEILIVVVDQRQQIYNKMSNLTLLFIHSKENKVIARTILQH